MLSWNGERINGDNTKESLWRNKKVHKPQILRQVDPSSWPVLLNVCVFISVSEVVNTNCAKY